MTGRPKRRAKPRPKPVAGPDYRLIFRNSPTPAYVADAGTQRILAVNDAAVARYGYSRAEFLKLTARDIRPPREVASFESYLKAEIPKARGFATGGTWRHRARNGDEFDVEVSWSPTQFRRRPAIVVFALDISRRLQYEATLRRSARALATIHEAVIISDRSGAVADLNPSAEELLGRSRHAIIGRPVEAFHGPGALGMADILGTATRDGQWRGRVRLRRPDGSIRIADTVVVPLIGGDGVVDGFVGVNRDVTEQVVALESHRTTASRLEAVFSTSPVAMYVLDPDLVVQEWNPAAERIFGWTAAETIGRVLPILGPADLAEERSLMVKVSHREPVRGVEVVRRRKDGSLVTIALSSAPLYDADGRFGGLSTIAVDVTDRQLLESQLRQAQRMESVGRLSGGIAHDFNNLLTAILGSAEWLRTMLPAQSPELEEVLEIEKASRRAADLTHQLLAFSRQQMLAPDILDLNALIAELTRMLGRVVGEDIHFETHLAKDVERVRADPGQVGQVLMNLVVNARDAMPEGGVLTIATATAQFDAQYVSEHPGAVAGDFIAFSVTDTGTGIAPEVLPHIFDPFFTTKAPGVGTGLGLATAYGIVKQSGGYIWVYSELGKGTTFKVYLPRWIGDDAPRVPRRTPVPTTMRGSETILVVEDEPGIRRLLTRTLTDHGYKVIAASDALEAVTKLAQMQGGLDLLATDVVMPGMGGRELADQVRGVHPGVKVLFLSGYTEDAIIRHGVLPPTNAFLEKPFTPAELLKKVRTVLDQSASEK